VKTPTTHAPAPVDDTLDAAALAAPTPQRSRPSAFARFGHPRTVRLSLLALSVAIALGAWEIAGLVSSNGVLPTVPQVIDWMQHASWSGIWDNVAASWRRVLVGFGCGVAIALVVGTVTGWYTKVRLLSDPWIQFFRNVPPLALIPLMIILFGLGELPKYVVIGFAAFLPTTVAVQQGVIDVDRNLISAARVLGANQRQIFARVVVPAAAPVILVGARLALGNCWGTLVAAELIASKSGLGYMTSQGQLYFSVPEIYVAILLIGTSGLIMDRVLFVVQQRLTSWQERQG